MTNFCAGRYEADLLPLKDARGAVGTDTAECLCILMDSIADQIQGFGKGAIVGANERAYPTRRVATKLWWRWS